MKNGPYVVLGGNGLGKTTIVQALIYGLAGELGERIEEQKSLRWSHDYFRHRLDKGKVSSSFVEVEFTLGVASLGVRRGFTNSGVAAFRNNKSKDWIVDTEEAQKAFSHALLTFGGYRDSSDFAFVVHRLLYLDESRRLLAWDNNAQLRILMLLNQDAVSEEDFRRRRAELKEMDSEKRHLHVALGKIIERLESLQPKKKPARDSHPDQSPKEDLRSYVEQAQRVAKQRGRLEDDQQTLSANLTRVSSEIEELREGIEQAESFLVQNIISSTEAEQSLPLFKLADNGICPACGTKQPKLQAIAHRHLSEGRCLICGSNELQDQPPELLTLQSQLSELMRSQQTIEGDFRVVSSKLTVLKREEDALQVKMNKIRYAQPVITLIERDLPPTSKADLLSTKNSLEQQEADFEAQILSRQSALERDYRVFRSRVNDRINYLRETYSTYATEFLGIPCSLLETPTKELVSLSRFVPMFNEIPRKTPESCSESQRFFLDIAFRLALIDHIEGDHGATFVCETPETALDLSYIANVVRMFKHFLKKGHSLFITANIQRDSIAHELLKTVGASDHKPRVLNLLEFGQLGSVHTRALPKLKATARRIIG